MKFQFNNEANSRALKRKAGSAFWYDSVYLDRNDDLANMNITLKVEIRRLCFIKWKDSINWLQLALNNGAIHLTFHPSRFVFRPRMTIILRLARPALWGFTHFNELFASGFKERTMKILMTLGSKRTKTNQRRL